MQRNIYLIGPMGAGKTSVGRHLARLLGRGFIDTDAVLEQRTGVSVAHIFEVEGEGGFRERERKLLAELASTADKKTGAVVATGGGAILLEANRKAMRKTGTVIYLRASTELLLQRLKDCQSRPLLSAADPQSIIAELQKTRAPLYAGEADHTFDMHTDTAAKTAEAIHAALKFLREK